MSKGPKKPKYDDKRKNKGGETPEQLKPSRWKAGQSGNTAGRPKLPPELKMITKLTRAELVEVGELVIMRNVAELRRLRRDDTISVLQAMFVGVCLRIMRDGSMEHFDKLLSRFIGKVKDEHCPDTRLFILKTTREILHERQAGKKFSQNEMRAIRSSIYSVLSRLGGKCLMSDNMQDMEANAGFLRKMLI